MKKVYVLVKEIPWEGYTKPSHAFDSLEQAQQMRDQLYKDSSYRPEIIELDLNKG